MVKVISFLVFIFLSFVPAAHAADENFVTPVFPVRDRQYWREDGNYRHFAALRDIVLDSKLPATWLLHYDVLTDKELIDQIKEFPQNQEIGLFLEVTRKLAEDSYVLFDWEHDQWSSANKLFLSGYSLSDRQKIIDNAFNSFKQIFGYYPHSYGAWYTDVYSMEYIKSKYNADINLGLADQYSTDGYQTWGQYINQPYIVSKKSAIEPAKDNDDSTGVLKVLWAPREPTLSFGDSVEFSNFSLQLNDYFRTKKLPHLYFTDLIQDLTTRVSGPISQVVIGLEVAEVNDDYLSELKNQLSDLKELPLKVSTLNEFNKVYKEKFNLVSPPLFLSSSVNGKASYWYMSPQFRMGIFVENGQVILKDLRYYHQNDWRDNDQSQIDPRHNLSRVVPGLVDQVVYGNQIVLGPSQDLKLDPKPNKVFAQYPAIPKPKNASISPTDYSQCFDTTGGFTPPYSCIKSILNKATHFVPDLRYSNISNQKYLGFAIGAEDLLGIRFPSLKIGILHFDFPILSNFLSLRKKLIPHFSWFGKQEYEASQYQGKIIDKQDDYGQDNLRKFSAKDKLFENGYYLILKP